MVLIERTMERLFHAVTMEFSTNKRVTDCLHRAEDPAVLCHVRLVRLPCSRLSGPAVRGHVSSMTQHDHACNRSISPVTTGLSVSPRPPAGTTPTPTRNQAYAYVHVRWPSPHMNPIWKFLMYTELPRLRVCSLGVCREINTSSFICVNVDAWQTSI